MIKASSLANLNFGWRKETSVWGRSFRLLEKLKRWRRILKHWTAPKNMRRAGIHQWKNLKPDWILSAQENSTLTWNPSWDNDVINAQANMKDVPTDVTHEIKSQNEPSLSIISIMCILELAKYTQRSRKNLYILISKVTYKPNKWVERFISCCLSILTLWTRGCLVD